MAIRFFDSGKFKDPWYRALTPRQKAIFEFAISECDCGGIFKIDLPSIAFHVNDRVCAKDLEVFKDRFVYLSKDTVFIPRFITWQYKKLNPGSNPHKGAIKCLERAGVDWQTLTPNNPTGKPFYPAPAAVTIPDDPDAGTFRVRPKTPLQSLGTRFVQKYHPEIFKNADKDATAEWFRRYGPVLSSILKQCNKNDELAWFIVLETDKQMSNFSKEAKKEITWGLEAVNRNLPENYAAAIRKYEDFKNAKNQPIKT